MAVNNTSAKVKLIMTNFMVRLILNIMFYIFMVVLIVNVSKAAYQFTYQLYGPCPAEHKPGTDITFQIKKGESTMDIANRLKSKKAIVNKYSFYAKVKIQNLKIMPGTYKINSSMTYNEILDIITDYSASIIQEDKAVKDAPGNGD
jgi:UPF0755 protein